VSSEAALAYLHGERRLARIATVGRDGAPDVPVGMWSYNPGKDTTRRSCVDRPGQDEAKALATEADGELVGSADGTWHDGLLMNLLARELRAP
jgi:hypothetical protein